MQFDTGGTPDEPKIPTRYEEKERGISYKLQQQQFKLLKYPGYRARAADFDNDKEFIAYNNVIFQEYLTKRNRFGNKYYTWDDYINTFSKRNDEYYDEYLRKYRVAYRTHFGKELHSNFKANFFTGKMTKA